MSDFFANQQTVRPGSTSHSFMFMNPRKGDLTIEDDEDDAAEELCLSDQDIPYRLLSRFLARSWQPRRLS